MPGTGISVTGDFDENEFMQGKGTIETEVMRFEGNFVNSVAEGEGRMLHLDTGNVFTGVFEGDLKHGKARFEVFTEGGGGTKLTEMEIEEI